jgi:hypothetical protein
MREISWVAPAIPVNFCAPYNYGPKRGERTEPLEMQAGGTCTQRVAPIIGQSGELMPGLTIQQRSRRGAEPGFEPARKVR